MSFPAKAGNLTVSLCVLCVLCDLGEIINYMFPGKKIFITAMTGLILSAYAGDYNIESFNTERVVPQHSDYLVPLQGKLLEALDTVVLEEGQMLLRRKFGKDDYALFMGRINKSRTHELNMMNTAGAFNLDHILKTKFYARKYDNFWKDLEDVYFTSDGEVYVLNRAALYYVYKDEWREISVAQSAPADGGMEYGKLTGLYTGSEDFTGELEKKISLTFVFTAMPTRVRDYYDRKKKALILEFHDVELGQTAVNNVYEHPITGSEIYEIRKGLVPIVRVILYTRRNFPYQIEKTFGTVILRYSLQTRKKKVNTENPGIIDLLQDLGGSLSDRLPGR